MIQGVQESQVGLGVLVVRGILRFLWGQVGRVVPGVLEIRMVLGVQENLGGLGVPVVRGVLGVH